MIEETQDMRAMYPNMVDGQETREFNVHPRGQLSSKPITCGMHFGFDCFLFIFLGVKLDSL